MVWKKNLLKEEKQERVLNLSQGKTLFTREQKQVVRINYLPENGRCDFAETSSKK